MYGQRRGTVREERENGGQDGSKMEREGLWDFQVHCLSAITYCRWRLNIFPYNAGTLLSVPQELVKQFLETSHTLFSFLGEENSSCK